MCSARHCLPCPMVACLPAPAGHSMGAWPEAVSVGATKSQGDTLHQPLTLGSRMSQEKTMGMC